MQQLNHLVQVQPTVTGLSVEAMMPAFTVIVSSDRLAVDWPRWWRPNSWVDPRLTERAGYCRCWSTSASVFAPSGSANAAGTLECRWCLPSRRLQHICGISCWSVYQRRPTVGQLLAHCATGPGEDGKHSLDAQLLAPLPKQRSI